MSCLLAGCQSNITTWDILEYKKYEVHAHGPHYGSANEYFGYIEKEGNFVTIVDENSIRNTMLIKDTVQVSNVPAKDGNPAYQSVIFMAEKPPMSGLYVIIGFGVREDGEERFWIEWPPDENEPANGYLMRVELQD